MTEKEWLECVDPDAITRWLQGKASDRKLRLFAVASCRRVWHLLSSDISQPGVEVVERFVDGEATDEELAAVHREAKHQGDQFYRHSQQFPSRSAESDLAYRDSQQAHLVASAASMAKDYIGMVVVLVTQCAGREIAGYRPQYDQQSFEEWDRIVAADQPKQAVFLRDIFHNPFQPTPAISLPWLTWNNSTIPKLAQAIYTERAFDRMPILADALEEAGCNNEGILGHCRGSGLHVKGCWLLDVVLGKE